MGCARNKKVRGNRTQTAPAAKADVPREQCPSPERGRKNQHLQVSGQYLPKSGAVTLKRMGAGSSAHQRAGELAPEVYKRGSLGRPYMVARAPGLASMIPLAVKKTNLAKGVYQHILTPRDSGRGFRLDYS
ncbi:hypothetical protein NDU88_002874 [Pleurodeles waltl]|uniref:Uncharacterized protein n=1 Tax=Pleurodeles waltl TaxID=8319 RepID=A0AAV7W0J1_PLEWA|nr:hypothetical protein NDU88_002874 [Pleurodeles waltl]